MAVILIFVLYQIELIAQAQGVSTVMQPIDGKY